MNKSIYFSIIVTLSFLYISCSPTEKDTFGCKISLATNFDMNATIANNCLCKYDGINSSCAILNPSSIFIPPVQQETEEWCWLAVGEMIFRYYGLPTVNPGMDYQCGIIGAVGYSTNGACDACNINCGNCVRPAGSSSMISYMLTIYPKIACRDLFSTNHTLKNSFVPNYLSPDFLINELNNNRPVIAGINPGSPFVLPGNSQHVALIKGYYFDLNSNLILKVNDPFPYYSKGVDPYASSGAINNGDLSYEIPFVNFVNGLQWNTTWYSISW